MLFFSATLIPINATCYIGYFPQELLSTLHIFQKKELSAFLRKKKKNGDCYCERKELLTVSYEYNGNVNKIHPNKYDSSCINKFEIN